MFTNVYKGGLLLSGIHSTDNLGTIKMIYRSATIESSHVALSIQSTNDKNKCSLQWRHNGRDSVSNHRRLDCLLICLLRCRSKKTSKLLVTDICEGKSPMNSPHKGPVTRKMFPFGDFIMYCRNSHIHAWYMSPHTHKTHSLIYT